MNKTELFSLTGRRALVTGSSRGIGFAIAEALAAAGAEVILHGRDQVGTERAAELIRVSGARASALAFDITNSEEVHTALSLAEGNIGPIDILVNNAGIQFRGPLLDFSDEDFAELLDIHIRGAFRVGRSLAKRMISRGHGRIINVCSILSGAVRPGVGPYCAAKAGLANLTRAMAAEWAPEGLTVNGIAPGYVRTDLTATLSDDPEFNKWLQSRVPMGRWGEPHEIAGAVVFLASDAASFVNGHVLVIDGGLTATI